MKRFRFALDPILQLKCQQLKQIERQLAKFINDYQTAIAVARRCEQELQSLGIPNKQVESGQTMHAKHCYVTSVERQGAAAYQQATRAMSLWQKTHAEYVSKHNEIEALENYRHSEQRRHDYEVSRREQSELDEIVLRDWSTGGEA